jgi:hypothetical protein
LAAVLIGSAANAQSSVGPGSRGRDSIFTVLGSDSITTLRGRSFDFWSYNPAVALIRTKTHGRQLFFPIGYPDPGHCGLAFGSPDSDSVFTVCTCWDSTLRIVRRENLRDHERRLRLRMLMATRPPRKPTFSDSLAMLLNRIFEALSDTSWTKK